MGADAQIYRHVVDSSIDGLWVIDARGRTLFANARVGELLGRPAAEIAAIGVGDVLDERDRIGFEAHLVALRQGGPDALDVLDTERVYRRPDGTAVPLMVSEQPLYDDHGDLIGYLHRLADDTRRRTLLEELRRSRSRLAEAQTIARLGSWEIDTVRDEVIWSRAMYDLLDVDPVTFAAGPEGFIAQVVEADRECVREAWERIGTEPGEHTVDARVRRRDGSARWVRAVGRALEYAEDGTPVRFGGTVQDIDALKEAELSLLDAVEINTLMQFIATAANRASTFDEALDSSRELLMAHPDWQRGVAFDATPNGPVFRPVGPGDDVWPTPLEYGVAERALAACDVVFEELQVPEHPMIGFPVMVEGSPRTVLVITNRSPFDRHAMMRSLVTQVAGQLAQVIVRQEAAGQLAAARDLAMAGSQAKSEFLATMSHEIRTPLNGVIGLNELLLRTDLDPRQRELAEAMQGAGRALLMLISDVLDFSKIEAGGLELEAVAFQPAVVVDGTRELFAPVALAQGIALEVEIDPSVPERLEGDPSRFGQVLSNLVSNAVKFTHQGSVRIRVSAYGDEPEVVLRVEVTDTGIGMDADQLGRIFQPFRQADASTTRTFGGTGLGLAIAHRLAGALGGEIGVRSEPGEGSTFWFTGRFLRAPAASRPRAESTRTGEPGHPGGHVLVVEDNEVNQLVAVGMLETLGYTCEVAADGAAAAARAVGDRFDAVLMDLQMPRLDGFAATRLIRQSEPPGVRVPIIALTASATAGEEQRCLEAGMTGFLSKPVSLEALGRVLEEQLAPAPKQQDPARVSPPTAARLTPALDSSRLDELAEMGPAAAPLIQRAIDNFTAGAAHTVEALRALWKAADADGLRAGAHRLKGSAANLGAARVAATAYELELLAEYGDLADAGPLLVDLSSALDEAVEALAHYELVVEDDGVQSA